jgi:hypothetical protein
MSDADVSRALATMEALLEQEPFPLEPEAIAAWRAGFEGAVASAERGPGWELILTRAHAVGARVAAVVANMQVERDELRRQIGLQSQGGRALRGYRPQG